MNSSDRHSPPGKPCRLLISSCLSLLFLLLTACSPAQPETPAATASRRIVSLAPSLTEMLFALGLGDDVVAVTQYCITPEAAKRLPKVGSWNDVSVEQLLTLNPTAICLADTHPARSRLAAAGLPLVPVRGQTFSESQEAIMTLGEAFGRQQQAAQLLSALKSRQGNLRRQSENLPRLRLLFVLSRTRGENRLRDLIVAGDDGYFRELATLLNCDVVPSGTGVAYPALSLEGILALAPDAIIEIAPEWEERGEPGRAQLTQEWRNALPQLKATEPGRMLVFTENHATVPGMRSLDFAEQLAQRLAPLRRRTPLP